MIIPDRKNDPTQTPAKPHHLVLSLAVQGTSGLMASAVFNFVDGLNVLIGGQGSGKTTVLEYIRYLLQRAATTPDADEQVEATLRNGKLVGALQMKHGGRYTATRIWGQPTTSLIDAKGAAADAGVDELFPFDYYASGQLLKIANDTTAQLALLDRFARKEMGEFSKSITAVLRQLKDNAKELVRLATAVEAVRADAIDAKLHEERLKELVPPSGGRVEGLQAAQAAKGLRAQECSAFEASQEALAQTRRDAATFSSNAVRRLAQLVSGDLLSGPNKQIMGTLAAHIHTKAQRGRQKN